MRSELFPFQKRAVSELRKKVADAMGSRERNRSADRGAVDFEYLEVIYSVSFRGCGVYCHSLVSYK